MYLIFFVRIYSHVVCTSLPCTGMSEEQGVASARTRRISQRKRCQKKGRSIVKKLSSNRAFLYVRSQICALPPPSWTRRYKFWHQLPRMPFDDTIRVLEFYSWGGGTDISLSHCIFVSQYFRKARYTNSKHFGGGGIGLRISDAKNIVTYR